MPKRLSSLLQASLTTASKNLRPRASELETAVHPVVCTTSSSSAAGGKGLSVSQPKKPSSGVSSQVLQRLKRASSNNSDVVVSNAESSVLGISSVISSILHGREDGTSDLASSKVNDEMIGWSSNLSRTSIRHKWKLSSTTKKQKYIFKNTQSKRFLKLMEMCANKVGTESTVKFFGNMGRETGVMEYNALIRLCIDKARQSSDKETLLGQIDEAYKLFLSMREKGFEIAEETYGPFLNFMIEMELAKEFQFYCKFFKDGNPLCCARIGFYEMLLCIRVGDEQKIRELCDFNIVAGNEKLYGLAESYLLAFCESNRKEELLQLLEVIDIMNISSSKYKASIFRSLGRLQLEKHTEKFILQLKTAGTADDNDISVFIYEYVSSLPNLAAEDIVSDFNSFHEKFGVLPAASSCYNLITFCCKLCEIPAALDVADYMCKYGLVVPIEAIDQMLHACGHCCELQMVYPIYFMMRRHNLRPKGETLNSMINMHVKMKDFEGAYKLLADMIEMNELPTTSMYNSILAGYFREKNNVGAKMVLKQMKDANIKPDAETFSYLISNCECEEDIVKYQDQMRLAGIKASKYIYMSLINAYANLQNFEMAKEIVLDHEIHPKNLNEIKSVLVSALSSNGQIYDALDVFDEIKQDGCNVEMKAVIGLIECLQVDGQLDRLLQLLEELNGSSSWYDGCSRVILYCVHHNITDTAVKLLKQLKEKDIFSTYIVIDQICSQIWETEPANLEIGLKLLKRVKDELELQPSRISLDFLLGTCVKRKDLKSAQIVWSVYKKAGLPYNFLTYLRMYEALLASGHVKAARRLSKKISKEDVDVRLIIRACNMTYLRKK